MAYTLRVLIDMIQTVSDSRTVLQKMYQELEKVSMTSGGIPSSATTDDLNEGSLNLYFTPQRVINTSLTGLSTSNNSDVTENDSILIGIGKLQAKASSYGTSVGYNIGSEGVNIPVLSGTNTWSQLQTFNGGINGNLSGNASTTDKLKNPININLNGSVKGSVQFDGSQDVLINTSFSKFDGTYATSIGGYPLGAILLLNDGVTDVVSTVANNLTNPNVDMTGWKYKLSFSTSSNLTPTANFDNVPQLETNNPSLGGIGGLVNAQAQALLNRIEFLKINNNAVKFLKASEIGLVSWTDFTLPPYTTQQYDQAYNNGVNLANAINAAYQAGYSKCVLERGNYPVCYSNMSGSTSSTNITSNTSLDSIENFEVDLNSSTLFVIFDSNNRSPYDKGTTLAPYMLPGSVFMLSNNTNLTIRRATLRGDEYMRSWVTGEENTEQTYGIYLKSNNINTKIEEMSYTGFRGDGLSGAPKGVTLYDISTWNQGGVDSSGNDLVETGSYRTGKLDLAEKTILRNAVQINSGGTLRGIEFRNDLLTVFFYDQAGVFQSSEKCRQTDFIFLPKNCRYVQFVAKDDERTTSTVSYGTYVFLSSGNSDGAEIVRSRFYENHRGGISNLCGNTIINDCSFNDEGDSKQGFKPYANNTRYAINFEDSYVSKLTVINCNIKNHLQAIMCNARNLFVQNNLIQDITYGGVGAYSTVNAIVAGNTFDNVGITYSLQTTNEVKKRFSKFSGNIVKNSLLNLDVSAMTGAFLDVSNNIFTKSLVSLKGNGVNLEFNNNTATEVQGQYVATYVVTGALSCAGNKALKNNSSANSIGWSYIGLDAEVSRNNYLNLSYADNRVAAATTVGSATKVSGMIFKSSNMDTTQYFNNYRTGWETHTDNITFSDCAYDNTKLVLGQANSYTQLCPANIYISGCNFKNAGRIDFSRRETTTGSVSNLVISDTVFDLTSSTMLFNNIYALLGTLNITFVNCTFKSSTSKSLAFVQGNTTNITATAIGCRFINVTNTDSILQVNGTASKTYDPPSLAAGATQSTTVTLTGASVGSPVACSFSVALSGTRMWAEVTATNTVTVYHNNPTASAVDVASGTLTVKLI